jgi:acyl-coenzyme A synthetase/AMP-(fatty) acid ligase
VVLQHGFTASDDLKHELQQHCKQVAAPYKHPREVEFVSELPKTVSGKTRHVVLRQINGHSHHHQAVLSRAAG